MEIRQADINDIEEISKLYYDTIVAINAKDYNNDQIKVWASTAWTPIHTRDNGWVRRIEEQYFYVALLDKKIVGFASLDKTGYLDLLYVHKDHQQEGIGSKLLAAMERIGIEMEFDEINVQSSITAKPFFEAHGFKVTGEKHKMVDNVAFTNAIMVKRIKQAASNKGATKQPLK